MDQFLRGVVRWCATESEKIELVAPRSEEWAARFATQRAMILGACPDVSVEHIGSTAVPGLWAQNVVDVLVGVPAPGVDTVTATLESAGYTCEARLPGHAWLCWPAPERREAVIHVMELGSEAHARCLLFRNRLRESPELAAEYEALKLALAVQTSDRSDYTARKAAFVARVVALNP